MAEAKSGGVFFILGILPVMFLVLLLMVSLESVSSVDNPFEKSLGKSLDPGLKKLYDEQKYSAALDEVRKIRSDAEAKGDLARWTYYLVEEFKLKTALHAYETALKEFMEAKKPEHPLAKSVLALYGADAMNGYLQSYSYEIMKREKVAGRDPLDFDKYTKEELVAEIRAAYLGVFADRERLETVGLEALPDFLNGGTYPKEVLGNVRDFITVSSASFFSSGQYWTPMQSRTAYKIGADLLLDRERLSAGLDKVLADPSSHPLLVACSVLAADEKRALEKGRRPLALELHARRSREVFENMTGDEDKRRVIAELKETLGSFEEVSWYSMGCATVAELESSTGDVECNIRAKAWAMKGKAAYPSSPGGQRCASIIARIEAPDFRLETMSSDNPGFPSIRIEYKNIGRLYFFLFPVDVKEMVFKYHEMPRWNDLYEILKASSPHSRFSRELEGTPDHNYHRAYVDIPPGTPKGGYVVVAAAKDTIDDRKNKVVASLLSVSDMALLSSRDEAGRRIGYSVLTGSEGRPVPGATLTAVNAEWGKPPSIVASAVTDGDGRCALDGSKFSGYYNHYVFARKGEDSAFIVQYNDYSGEGPERANASVIFTDRRVYRVGQKVFFKVVAFASSRGKGPHELLKNHPVEIELKDVNYQVVAKVELRTNSHGSASGEFAIPSGRPLGGWYIGSSINGGANILVEEYKRPTFEVELKPLENPPRLNTEVKIRGVAKYYFGMPLTAGGMDYTITRIPNFPWWCWWFRPMQKNEIVGSGAAALKEDGTFEISFTPEADERMKEEKGVTYTYSVAVNVTDEGGETRNADKSFRIGFVSLEPTVTPKKNFFLKDEKCAFDMGLHDLDGTPVKGAGSFTVSELKLPGETVLPAAMKERVADERYKLPGDRLKARWDSQPSLEQSLSELEAGARVKAGEVSFDEKGAGETVFGPLPPGAYRVRVEVKDRYGETAETFRDFIVAEEGFRFTLPFMALMDKDTYEAGEKATVLVASGYDGSGVFLKVFTKAGLFEKKWFSGGSASIISIPVTEELRGGVNLEASAIKDHAMFVARPTSAVPWSDKELKVKFETFRERITPGVREVWKVKVLGDKDAPVGRDAIELLASMYDKSLDIFAPHGWGGITQFFPRAFYPHYSRTSLGKGEFLMERGYDLYDSPGYPTFYDPHLLGISGYGVGGPGRRRYMTASMKSKGEMAEGVMGGAIAADEAMPAPPPAAAPMEAEKKDAASQVASREAVPKKNGGGEQAQAPQAMRENFNETAFFYPHLLTESDGSVSIEFVPPDSLTKYKLLLFAHGDGVVSGGANRECEAIKDFMVRPYLPRFFREGDEIAVKVMVNNASKKPLDCALGLKITDAGSGKDVTSSFNPDAVALTVSVKAGGSTAAAFALRVPKELGDVKVEIAGRSGDMTDGERRVLPILPSRMHLVESKFVTLREGETRKVVFEDLLGGADKTRTNDKLVLTVDAQLLYGVLEAMPYLVEYPYECNEQLVNKFVAVGILNRVIADNPPLEKLAREFSKRETKYESFNGEDPNRTMMLEETPWLLESKGGIDEENPVMPILNPDVSRAVQETALRKLLAAQDGNGGWAWWAGGKPEAYMTLYIVYSFSKAMEFGVEVPEEPIRRAFRFLRREGLNNDVEWCMAHDCCWEFITFLNYTLSNFKDRKYYEDSFDEGLRRKMADFSFKHWKSHSPYLKLQLAMTLERMERVKDARLVHESVFDSAKSTRDEGTFWAAEDKSWLWYNDTVETHAFALKELMEVDPKDEKGEGLMVWLFLNKKLNHWKSTRSTAEALYSILSYLRAKGAIGVRETVDVAVGGGFKKQFVYEPDAYTGKKNQVVFERESITMDSGNIEFTKGGKGIAFASATLHFSTDELPAQGKGDLFAIERTFYKRVQQGAEWVLEPMNEATMLQVGDQIEVELKVRSKHPAEYIHIRAPRPSGCEPEKLRSGYSWNLGLYYYETVRDSAEDFFVDQIPQGEFKMRYRLRAAQGGTFRVAPATIESLYAPEFAAFSSGRVVKIGEKQ